MDRKKNSFFYENKLEDKRKFCSGFLVETTGEADCLVRRNLSRIDPFLPMFFFVPLSLACLYLQAKQVQERVLC